MKNRLLIYVAAALVFPMSVALASGPPEMKEGLWSLDRQTIDNPGNKKEVWPAIKICRNHAYDEYVMGLTKKMTSCTTTNESTQGNKYSTGSKCVVGKTTIVTKGTTTFESDTAAHGESQTTYTPAMDGKSETIMITDSKYIGSCPAGVQPGDRINADGSIAHGWKH